MFNKIQLKRNTTPWITPSVEQTVNAWEPFVNISDEKLFISKWDWTYFEVITEVEINQYTKELLSSWEDWIITHPSDPNFNRIVQVYNWILDTNNSLDFDTIDESNFIQENSNKTSFQDDKIQLKWEPSPLPYSYWALNETSWTLASDSSPNNRNWTLVNMENWDWIQWKIKNWLEFGWVNEYVNFWNIANFEANNTFSLECWFKANNITTNQTIISKFDESNFMGYLIKFNQWDELEFLLSTSTWAYIWFVVSEAFDDNIWHHLVFTYDWTYLTSGIKVYVDWVSKNLTIYNDDISSGTMQTNVPFQIWAKNWEENFVGSLDEVVVYDTELNQTEVLYRYNSGNGIWYSNNYPTDKWYYVSTSSWSQINTSTWESIKSLTFWQTTPTNTQIKYLVSIDWRTTWKKWNWSTWITESLTNIATNWNTKTELEALNKDDFNLLFTAWIFDIVADLKTTDNTKTPELIQINIEYYQIWKSKCKDSEITIKTINSTTTTITNDSWWELTKLRANILIK